MSDRSELNKVVPFSRYSSNLRKIRYVIRNKDFRATLMAHIDIHSRISLLSIVNRFLFPIVEASLAIPGRVLAICWSVLSYVSKRPWSNSANFEIAKFMNKLLQFIKLIDQITYFILKRQRLLLKRRNALLKLDRLLADRSKLLFFRMGMVFFHRSCQILYQGKYVIYFWNNVDHEGSPVVKCELRDSYFGTGISLIQFKRIYQRSSWNVVNQVSPKVRENMLDWLNEAINKGETYEDATDFLVVLVNRYRGNLCDFLQGRRVYKYA